MLLSVFSLSVSLYLRVSPVDTQKHVCLFVLLPPGHSASATVKSLGWEGHTGVGTDPAPPHLCCDLYPLLLRAVGAHSAHHETPAGLVWTHGGAWHTRRLSNVESDLTLKFLFKEGLGLFKHRASLPPSLPFFLPLCMACRILIRWLGTEPRPQQWKMPSPNHWATRKFPLCPSLCWWHWMCWPNLSSRALVKSSN